MLNKSLTKISVIFNRLGPYHDSRLKSLRKYFDVTSIEICKTDRTYQWNELEDKSAYGIVNLFQDEDFNKEEIKFVRNKTHSSLKSTKPDVVAIPGWSDKVALIALDWCNENKVPIILMSESTEADFKRYTIKELIKSSIVNRFSSALVGGLRARDYLIKLGFKSESIFLGYDVVDNHYFQSNSDKARRSSISIRNKLGLPADYFLASNRFVDKKNIPGLINSYAQYVRKVKKPWSFVLLGDGPLKGLIIKQIEKMGISSLMKLPGFVQYDLLPSYYGLANVFVHASTSEQWGLVVNEAMAAGLPMLVSNRCGCSSDLIQEGMNGFTFDPYDRSALTNLMIKLTDPQMKLKPLGEKSRKIIRSWSPKRFADGMKAASECAIINTTKRDPAIGKLVTQLMIRRPSFVVKRDK